MGGKAASQQPDEWVRREIAAIQANQRKTKSGITRPTACQ